jgi:hypothetical protein
MKSLKFLAAVILLLTSAAPVFAQSATKSVPVTVILTPLCRFTSGSASGAINMGTYAAFRSSDLEVDSAALDIECTRGGTGNPSFSFGTGDAKVGVVNGLAYELNTTYTAGVAGATPDGTPANIGTARTGSVKVKATMYAGQAGSGSGASATDTKTLTVSF